MNRKEKQTRNKRLLFTALCLALVSCAQTLSKAACDILEENLSDNIHFDFKDIKFRYEPHGRNLIAGDTEPRTNIVCTSK